MISWMLFSLGLSLLATPFFIWVVYSRRSTLQHAFPWAQITAISMTLSVWSYALSLFGVHVEAKRLLYLMAIFFLNLSAIAASFFVLALVFQRSRWLVRAAIASSVVLGLAYIPLLLGEATWRTVVVEEAWLQVQVPVSLPGRFWRAALTWIILALAFLVAAWQRLRGLSLYRWRQVLIYFVGLLLPYLWWAVDTLWAPFPGLSLLWTHIWVTVVLWTAGMYWGRLGEIPVVTPEQVLHHSETGVLVFAHPEHDMLWWNERVARWFGGEEGLELPADLLVRLPVLLGMATHRQVDLPTREGVRTFQITSVALKANDRPVAWALLLHDITEEVSAAREIERQLVLASLREDLLAYGLEAESMADLAQRMVRRLAQPWPDFIPVGCALYLCEGEHAEAHGEQVFSGRLLAAYPEDKPWRTTWQGILQDLVPLEEVPLLPPDQFDESHVVSCLPLYTPDPENKRLWGQVVWVLPQEHGPAKAGWKAALEDLSPVLSFLLHAVRERVQQSIMEQAFAAMPVPVLLLNRRGTLRMWNRALGRLLEVQGVSLERFMKEKAPFTDQWLGLPLWKQILEGLETRGYWSQILIQERDGRKYYWWLAAYPIRRIGKEVVEIGLVLHDFYPLERARQEAQAQQAFLERLLHAVQLMWNALPSINRLLQEVLRLLRSWYPQAHVSLVLVDRDKLGRMYVTTWMRETGLQAVPPFFHRMLHEGAMGWALRHQRCLSIPDVQSSPHWSERDLPGAKVRSALVAPMFYRGRPLGVLVVRHPNPGQFTETDCQLLESMAHWLALALQNARLYEDETRLQRLHERLQQHMTRLRMNQERIFRYLSQELRVPLQAFATYLNQVQTQPPGNGVVAEVLDHIHHAVEDMVSTIDVYLDSQQRAQAQMDEVVQTFQIREVFQEIREVLQPLLERYQVTLEYEVSPKALEMTQPRRVLRQVLQYLVELGVRRSQGGQVVLRAFYDPESVPPGVVFWVLDTGEPVDPKEVERFLEADQAGGAVSSALPLVFLSQQINLALVRERVRDLEAVLQVRTVTGFGLAFWLWVPLRPSRMTASS